MTLYEELAATASKAVQVADEFYAEATVFVARFRQKLSSYLDTTEDNLVLRRIGDGPAWQWPPLPGTPLTSADVDPDLHFTFAISITLYLTTPLQWLIITPAFNFKPIHDGIEIFILNREPDGSLKKTDRFEIRDDAGWQPLFERCAAFWREILSFSPYDAERARIGFDISPAAKT